jgi:hypothetical protein
VIPEEWYLAPDLFDEITLPSAPAPIPRQDLGPTATAGNGQVMAPTQARDERTAPTFTMLSAYGEPEVTSQFRWWHGAILGLFILLFVGAVGVGGWWWSNRGSVAQAMPLADSNTVPPATNPSTSPSSEPTSTIASGQIITRSADEEITRLRERRSGTNAFGTSEILAAIQDAEKKYPNDYRFSYERSKLSIKGITTHHEAFSALALAANKAIDNGKAQEMLDSLVAAREGDFYKLSRGHHEWQALIQALSNKDKQGLDELHH